MSRKPPRKKPYPKIEKPKKPRWGQMPIETALEESEKKFKTWTDYSPNMIFVNQMGRVVYVNKMCEKVMGYRREEFLAPDFSFLDLIAPESRDRVMAAFARHKRGQDVEPYEYTLLDKSGRRIEALITTCLIDYEGGKAILGIVTDISERKRVEEALALKTQRLDMLHKMDRDILKMRSLRPIAAAALTHIEKLLPFKRASLTLFDFQAQQAIPVAAKIRGGPEIQVGSPYPLEIFNVPELRRGDLHYVKDISRITAKASLLKTIRREGLEDPRAFASLPLLSQEELIGSLNLMGDQPGIFQQEHLEIAREVADTLAVAIQHIRLLEQLRDELEERKKADGALRESEERFKELFENSPISLIEEDCSRLITYFKRLKKKRIADFRGYFETHPEEVERCVSLVRIIGVNRLTLELFGAETKADFLSQIGKVLGRDFFKVAKEALVVIGEGKTFFESEVTLRTLRGEKRHVFWKWSIVPGHEEDWSKVIVSLLDISPRIKIEKKQREAEKKLRFFSNQLISAQERERKRISIELHDELGQALVGLKFQMSDLKKKLARGLKEGREDLEKMLLYLDQVTENVRRLSRDLSPTILEHLGLDAALCWLFDQFSKEAGITVSERGGSLGNRFSKEQELIIYRIFQEALTNIRKHARARRVTIAASDRKDGVSLVVEDDGQGFNLREVVSASITERGLGLASMDERARMAGGTFKITSRKGKGTKITFTIPPSPGPPAKKIGALQPLDLDARKN
jgi:PAS domain S-box-containing protein